MLSRFFVFEFIALSLLFFIGYSGYFEAFPHIKTLKMFLTGSGLGVLIASALILTSIGVLFERQEKIEYIPLAFIMVLLFPAFYFVKVSTALFVVGFLAAAAALTVSMFLKGKANNSSALLIVSFLLLMPGIFYAGANFNFVAAIVATFMIFPIFLIFQILSGAKSKEYEPLLCFFLCLVNFVIALVAFSVTNITVNMFSTVVDSSLILGLLALASGVMMFAAMPGLIKGVYELKNARAQFFKNQGTEYVQEPPQTIVRGK